MKREEEIKKQKEEQLNKVQNESNNNKINRKALFPTSLSSNKLHTKDIQHLNMIYSSKLRNAAQYAVEMLSNKQILAKALIWSRRAIELFDNFSNYETYAYVLYKLGRRHEAIVNMEKAYTVALKSDGNKSVHEKVKSRLIKMKRGERIW
jgi:tetratricopeptide (TPR) repeat protein